MMVRQDVMIWDIGSDVRSCMEAMTRLMVGRNMKEIC